MTGGSSRGSVARAWVAGHGGIGGLLALGAVGLGGAGYGALRVPGPSGGPLPIWLLTPPTLALFAALATTNDLPDLLWSNGLRRARLLWALLVTGIAAAGAAGVGWAAGQPRLALFAAFLTGTAFGLSTAVGRGSVVVGAVPMLALLTLTTAVKDITPALLWQALPPLTIMGAVAVWGVSLATYAYVGPRRSASGPTARSRARVMSATVR